MPQYFGTSRFPDLSYKEGVTLGNKGYYSRFRRILTAAVLRAIFFDSNLDSTKEGSMCLPTFHLG